MGAVAAQRRAGIAWFAGIVSAVYLAAPIVVDQLPQVEGHANTLAAALTIDLVIVIPVAFYLLVVRRWRLPILTLIPVFVLSVFLASRILPTDHRAALRVFEALAVPIELGLLGWIGWRAAQAVRRARRGASADPIEKLRHAAFELTGNHRVAAVFASEIAVLSYALGSWRSRPNAPTGTKNFTHHRRSGHGGVVVGLVIIMACEGLAVHLLLVNWNALAAWIVTIGTAYGALWLVADYRATVLRPILVDGQRILLRAGLRFTLDVPLAKVVAIGSKKPEFGKESVNLTFLGTPTHWLTLSESMDAEGPYGTRRRVRAIGFEPDAAAEFDRVLSERTV